MNPPEGTKADGGNFSGTRKRREKVSRAKISRTPVGTGASFFYFYGCLECLEFLRDAGRAAGRIQSCSFSGDPRVACEIQSEILFSLNAWNY